MLLHLLLATFVTAPKPGCERLISAAAPVVRLQESHRPSKARRLARAPSPLRCQEVDLCPDRFLVEHQLILILDLLVNAAGQVSAYELLNQESIESRLRTPLGRALADWQYPSRPIANCFRVKLPKLRGARTTTACQGNRR